MKKYILISALVFITGCTSSLLKTVEEEAVNLDTKTLDWVNTNRSRICAKAATDPRVLTVINDGIKARLIHPDFCAK